MVVKVPDAFVMVDELMVDTLIVDEFCVMMLAESLAMLDPFKVEALTVVVLIDGIVKVETLRLDTANLEIFV
jgi:hypothetical protein